MKQMQLVEIAESIHSIERTVDHLLNANGHRFIISELQRLRNHVLERQQYHQRLECTNAMLKYQINSLDEELSSLYIPQPDYRDIHRIKDPVELQMMSRCIIKRGNHDDTIYHLTGQVVKRKNGAKIMFLELFIAPSSLIKVAVKKEHFSRAQIVDITSKCKLGSMIQCHGQIEDFNAKQLILIVDELSSLRIYDRIGFVSYREVNGQKAAHILCAHFVRHFVSNKDEFESLRMNQEYVPSICTRSKCKYRHRMIHQKEWDKIQDFLMRRTKVIEEEFDENDPFYHCKESKVARARLFGDWIVRKYGLSTLQSHGVLDIAGGGGDLANVLSEYEIPVTIIDPREPLKLYRKMQKEKRERMQPQHIDAYFEWKTLDENKRIKQLFNECAVVIGLHPDQATEPIVDVSLKFGKCFATLPCCVFPNLYPKYMTVDGERKEVVTYFEFIEYLKRKDAKIKMDYLPFRGRNKILFLEPS